MSSDTPKHNVDELRGRFAAVDGESRPANLCPRTMSVAQSTAQGSSSNNDNMFGWLRHGAERALSDWLGVLQAP